MGYSCRTFREELLIAIALLQFHQPVTFITDTLSL